MNHDQIIDWLLKGDVSIQYQVYRDLLGISKPGLREKIDKEGWGAKFLSKQHIDGHWGRKFYQPKWISTHYTLLDLKNLGIQPDLSGAKKALSFIVNTLKGPDGGISPFGAEQVSDVCVNGMFLNYASYFQVSQEHLNSVVDFLLQEKMPDGGFNCFSNRSTPAHHSSMHSTISVLEGLSEYEANGYNHKIFKVRKARQTSIEFLLLHQLFKSHRRGTVIDKKFLMLSFPSRWRYDILRALDYFQSIKWPYDPRMEDALQVLIKKRKKDGRWPLQARHPGQAHFDMEQTGEPSRWNTLRALRVLKHFNKV